MSYKYKISRPTRHGIGLVHFGDVRRSQSLGLVVKRLNPKNQILTELRSYVSPLDRKIGHYDKRHLDQFSRFCGVLHGMTFAS